MAKNDIALSFDKAEYYSLEEASEYLNRKHGIDNITPKKLLKHISSYDINTYIHFRMDNLKEHEKLYVECDFYNSNLYDNIKGLDIYTQSLTNEQAKFVVDIGKRLNEHFSNSILDDLYMGYILFKVDYHTISNMALTNQSDKPIDLWLFDGFVFKNNITDNPESPRQLKEWSVKVDENEYYMTDITNIHFVLTNATNENLIDFENKNPFPCTFEKVKEKTFIGLKIIIDDLLLLYKDLEQLESQIIENAPIPHKDPSKISENIVLQARQGVSLKKLEAKLIANTHAQSLWAKDHDKRIRISEMCNHVWNYLVDTEYQDQLPNERESLKDWIKNIPPHASEKGRPTSS